MGKQKILISHEEVPEKALIILKNKYELIVCPGMPYPSREQFLKDIKGTVGVLLYSKHKIDEEVIDAAGPDLKVIASMSAGYDNIDVPLLTSRNIKASNTPGVLSNCVAEVAVGLVLSTLRRLNEGYQIILSDRWETGRIQWMLGQSLEGSTVGIVGLGNIGCAIAKRLKAFDLGRLLYSGRTEKLEAQELGAEFMVLDEMLKVSDVVVISCALTSDTKHLFNKDKFKLMKPTSIIVNISRGEVIDQVALVEALQNKTIWGAGLDVMTPEPIEADHPLTKIPTCVLSPHVGSATIETRTAMAELAATNIYNALNGLPLLTPIN
uniref:Glyoxylate reductase/hydroxypyruvate reductase n=1 Tax=Clastoptera arizonana TaxID=38151 RepID=A0A1B6EDW6_9HEMI